MQGFEPHPKEKEMKVNHETLRQIQKWAVLLDGTRCYEWHDTGRRGGGGGWFQGVLESIGLAFFLGLIPGVGCLICTVLSYIKVYRPISRFMFDETDLKSLQRFAFQCMIIDFLIGLVYPISPFLRLFYCGNLRMSQGAQRLVLRHAEQSSKAFATSYCTTSAIAATMAGSTTSSLLNPNLIRRTRNPQGVSQTQTLNQRSPSPSPLIPALSSASPDPILILGQQQQQAEAPVHWYALLGDDKYYAHDIETIIEAYIPTTTTTTVPSQQETVRQVMVDPAMMPGQRLSVIGTVLPPPVGAQPRRHRGSESLYQEPTIVASIIPVENMEENENERENGEEGQLDSSPSSSLVQVSPSSSSLTTLSMPIQIPIPIPPFAQHRSVRPQYYYPHQGRLSDSYWRQSCPLHVGVGVGAIVTGFGASVSILRGQALARGCVSMSALPVARWMEDCEDEEGYEVEEYETASSFMASDDDDDEEEEHEDSGFGGEEPSDYADNESDGTF
ncbi:hypothetical protein BGX23_004260 [Mortierella sp. AD031]|nr:hypothetical protein BGX23_004260 [Mortierella sp. AD031]KAG0202389.1 hypothetical protein BGX33_009726 [Mortierella sp. NVP41]